MLIFLSDGIMGRRFCNDEQRWAKLYSCNFVGVVEKDKRHGPADFAAEKSIAPADLAHILDDVEFIEYRRRDFEVKAMITELMRRGGCSDIPHRSSRRELESGDAQHDSEYWINRKELKLGKAIGSGAFGMVFRARHQRWTYPRINSAVAVKFIARPVSLDNDTSPSAALIREVRIAMQFQHKNICQFLGLSSEPASPGSNARWLIVMELCDRSLWALLQDRTHILSWVARCQIATDIAAGMEYLHGLGLAHMDLKSLNVLVEGQTAKLTDFGSTRRFQDFVSSESTASSGAAAPQSCAGTPEWQAPEFIKLDGRTALTTEQAQKMDVFSYAMVLWELLSRQRPANGYIGYRQTGRANLIPHWAAQGQRPKLSSPATPSEWANLCTACWDSVPDARPAFVVILQRLHTIKRVARDWQVVDFQMDDAEAAVAAQTDEIKPGAKSGLPCAASEYVKWSELLRRIEGPAIRTFDHRYGSLGKTALALAAALFTRNSTVQTLYNTINFACMLSGVNLWRM
eukprot:COSAG01_NODE_56_length_31088_cov_39.354771_6_plen_516_part_00